MFGCCRNAYTDEPYYRVVHVNFRKFICLRNGVCIYYIYIGCRRYEVSKDDYYTFANPYVYHSDPCKIRFIGRRAQFVCRM